MAQFQRQICFVDAVVIGSKLFRKTSLPLGIGALELSIRHVAKYPLHGDGASLGLGNARMGEILDEHRNIPGARCMVGVGGFPQGFRSICDISVHSNM